MDDKLEQIADLIPCTRYDHYLATRCIFHQDRNPSLLIYPDRYYCKSCEAHGTTKKLLHYLQTGNFCSSQTEVYHPSLWRYLDHLDAEEICQEAYMYLQQHHDLAYYLRDRGVSNDFIRKFRLGFMDGYYTFPIRNQKNIVQGMVARAGPVLAKETGTRYLIPPGQDLNLLYCPDWSLVQSYIFVPFGILDAISLALAGFPAITGTVGHNLKIEAFQSLRIPLIFLPDGDGKDDHLARSLTSDWRSRIIFMQYPDGCKDCNDLLMKYGLETFKEIITNMMRPTWITPVYQKSYLVNY